MRVAHASSQRTRTRHGAPAAAFGSAAQEAERALSGASTWVRVDTEMKLVRSSRAREPVTADTIIPRDGVPSL
jgi:hypothetical protein